MTIEYENSDLIAVVSFLENGLIGHVVNDLGVMGAGIALQIAQEWPIVEEEYIKIVNSVPNASLGGKVLFVNAKPNVVVANLFAQEGIRTQRRGIPLRYDWLKQCLVTFFEYARDNAMDIRIPKIGSGLAGGDWDTIWQMILTTADECGYEQRLTLHSL